MEYNYAEPEVYESSYWKFFIAGFCELDKDFNRRFFPYRESFYCIEDIVPDSIRSNISNTLLKYQTDTTFLYQGGDRIYDGNKYGFIMQKYNQTDVVIKFEPQFLPEDLKSIFLYLYGDREREKLLHTRRYKELYEMFKSHVQDDEFPEFQETIKFTAPIIIEEK